jgi:hypothetical protein
MQLSLCQPCGIAILIRRWSWRAAWKWYHEAPSRHPYPRVSQQEHAVLDPDKVPMHTLEQRLEIAPHLLDDVFQKHVDHEAVVVMGPRPLRPRGRVLLRSFAAKLRINEYRTTAQRPADRRWRRPPAHRGRAFDQINQPLAMIERVGQQRPVVHPCIQPRDVPASDRMAQDMRDHAPADPIRPQPRAEAHAHQSRGARPDAASNGRIASPDRDAVASVAGCPDLCRRHPARNPHPPQSAPGPIRPKARECRPPGTIPKPARIPASRPRSRAPLAPVRLARAVRRGVSGRGPEGRWRRRPTVSPVNHHVNREYPPSPSVCAAVLHRP